LGYESGTDALRQLLFLGSHGAKITRSPEKIIALPGELYFYVEVTSKEGTRFVIEGYGEEARELEHEVSTRKGKEEMLITA
jgi:hypothetical protein